MSVEIEGGDWQEPWQNEKFETLVQTQKEIKYNKDKWITRSVIYLIYLIVASCMFHNVFSEALFLAVGAYLFYYHFKLNKILIEQYKFLDSQTNNYWKNLDMKKAFDEKQNILSNVSVTNKTKKRALL